VSKCKEDAHLSSVRYGFAFTGIILAQFMLSQYGTYYAFSWDIIEPITACVALSDACAAYMFWMWIGKPWELNSIRSYFFQRKLEKVLKKRSVCYQNYKSLKDVKAALKKQLFNN
jgi:hypothetical protein